MSPPQPRVLTGARRRRFLVRLAPWLVGSVWSLLVLYPNPTLLPRAIANTASPEIDPAAVQQWADELPDDPALIEQRVLDTYVPYAVPWQTLGVPWYFPTTREVVSEGRGDCQARMLVLASILEAKGIPYKLRASFDHIWVEYPKKQPSRLENQSVAILNDGKLRVPERWDWQESYRIEKEYFWDFMPWSRRLLFFGGLVMIALRRPLVRSYREVRARLRQPTPATEPAPPKLPTSLD